MKNTLIKSEYDLQAEKFLADTKTEIEIRYSHTGKHFNNDDSFRDIYSVTIQNEKHHFEFDFGQSIHHSGYYRIFATTNERKHFQIGIGTESGGNYPIKNHGLKDSSEKIFKDDKLASKCIKEPFDKNDMFGFFKTKNKDFSAPSEYDILASLTKYDPDTLENFCEDFGYNPDSKKGNEVYFAVQKEWDNVRKLWKSEEIEQLQEIQ